MAEMDLARLLAHELEPSLISLDLRLRSLAGVESCRREAEECLAEVESLRSLLRNLLLLGGQGLEKARFPLAPILDSLARRFAPLAACRGITLDVAGSAVEASGDPTATERALSNLVDNALKFSHDRSRVRVGVRETSESVEIEVEDFGVGIPASLQRRVFEPFLRVDREKPGAGLGLAIARRLAEAQGGRLSLASEPGQGTSLVLTLPRS